MIGPEFARVLRAAQSGDATAFGDLWRRANPLLVRYLRVAGHDDPYDGACETWVAVVRGLHAFRGDEADWRVWLLKSARRQAEEDVMRRGWSTGAGETLPVWLAGEDEPPATTVGRGLTDTLTALRALPLGQGEVVLLRLAGDLSAAAVADVLHTQEETVVLSEERAYERLGTDAALLAWSLGAPASAAELADEQVVTRIFTRQCEQAPRTGSARVIAVAGGRHAAPRRPWLPRRRSRPAAFGVVGLLATLASAGAVGAAANAGALPDPVQQVMHETIGTPAPATDARGTD